MKKPDDLYPLVRDYLAGPYAGHWTNKGIHDDDFIARSVLEIEGLEDCEAFQNEARRMLAREDFPWQRVLEWAERGSKYNTSEADTRAWLENYLSLIDKHKAALKP